MAELPSAIHYGSARLTYSDEELARAAQQLGHDTGYTGHLSGHSGDAESGTTTRVGSEIAQQARQNREKDKAAAKRGPVREQAAKSAVWKAFNKGYLLMKAALAANEVDSVQDAFQEYIEYLGAREDAGEISDEISSKCYLYWEEMSEGPKLIPPDESKHYVQ